MNHAKSAKSQTSSLLIAIGLVIVLAYLSLFFKFAVENHSSESFPKDHSSHYSLPAMIPVVKQLGQY